MFLIPMLGIQYVKAQQKTFKETINKEISFENRSAESYLDVENLNGSITVEGYDGNTILLTVQKSISANSTEKLELGKQEIGIKILKEGNKIIIYPQVPNMEYRDGRFTNINHNSWTEFEYDHNLDFNLKIPRNIKVKVGAINQGEVLVKNTKGSFIEARNINGGIVLENITGMTKVHCINGEVSISYAENPTQPSTYYALNGDINITYQNNLSADIAFKSMNGELFTDFDIVKQFMRTTKDESNKKNTKYRYEAKPVVQIGNGGMAFDFETLNGDVIIKKI